MMKKINILKVRHWVFAILFLIPIGLFSQEGTKQLSPSAGQLSALYYNPGLAYGSYYNAPEENAVKFVITDFAAEKFYCGFSWTTYASTDQGNTANYKLNYSIQSEFMFYRIIDSDGVVVASARLAPAANSPGQINTFAEAQAGPKRGAVNPAGYNPIVFTPTKNDIYTIEYWRGTNNSGSAGTVSTTVAISPFFDFTVATATTTKPGRVYATKWGLATTNTNANNGYWTSINNSGAPSFYVLTDNNNVLKLQYPNISPLAYAVGANFYGVNNTGNFTEDRKSINNNPTIPSLAGGFNLFLNDPDPVLFPKNTVNAQAPTFAIPLITPVDICDNAPFNIRFNVFTLGDYRIKIKGSGLTDRNIFLYSQNPGFKSVQWDGKDGAGTLIPAATNLTFEITSFQDRVNFPIVDAEGNVGGMEVTSLSPPGAVTSNLFWNDSELTPFDITNATGNSTGAGTDNSFVGSPSPTHAWAKTAVLQDNFGNGRTINTWAYAYEQTIVTTSNLLCADVTITKTVDNLTPAIGTNVVFTLVASNIKAGSLAQGVVVKDVLPAGYTLVSAVPASGSGTWTAPNWNVGDLIAGQPSKSIAITATVLASTQYTNVAEISTLNFEINYNNNQAYARVNPTAPDITVTYVCDINNLNPGYQLNDAFTGTIPTGSTLVWFTNNTHTGTALASTYTNTAGDYYAFYYDPINMCYSPASAKVTLIIPNCTCKKPPAGGTPDGFTKLGITTHATKGTLWPENIPNGFLTMESQNKGFVITRGLTSDIAVPVKGMLIYDTLNKCFSMYNGTVWHCIAQTCNE